MQGVTHGLQPEYNCIRNIKIYMKSIFVILFFVFSFFNLANAQSYNELVTKADSLLNAKEYTSSLTIYEQAFKIEMKNPFDIFNAARAASLAGEQDKAFVYLNASVDNGWNDFKKMKYEPDFEPLKTHAKWDEVMYELYEKLEVDSYKND